MFRRVETHFGPQEPGPTQPREITSDEYEVKIMTPEEAAERAKGIVELMFGQGATDPVENYEDGIDGEFDDPNWDAGLKPVLPYDEDEEDDEMAEGEEDLYVKPQRAKKAIEKILTKSDPALDGEIEKIKQKQKDSRKKATFHRG